MDMVCEKSTESDHDFSRDPIRLVYDGDWLRAENTTLEDAHSPTERLFIPSVGEVRDFMVALLASYGSK